MNGTVFMPSWMKGFWRHSTTDPKSCRILAFLGFNLGFMFVELAVGFWANSLGLVSDAGHMLFDCAALAIGLFAAYASKWSANAEYTYGYSRVEVLSGFINGVLLIFVAFAVFTESLHRLNEPPEVHSGHLIWTSTAGLIINIVGLLFFHEFSHGGNHGHDCGHAHGGGRHYGDGNIPSNVQRQAAHNHGHGECHGHALEHARGLQNGHGSHHDSDTESSNHGHSHSNGRCNHSTHVAGEDAVCLPTQTDSLLANDGHCSDHSSTSYSSHGASSSPETSFHVHNSSPTQPVVRTTDQNMRGIFLHVLADALGSVGVVVSSILIRYFGWSIADPICSLMISVLILLSVVPLIQDTAWVLLQHTPTRGLGSEPQALQRVVNKIRKLKGVSSVSCAHFWTIGSGERVATLHVALDEATMSAAYRGNSNSASLWGQREVRLAIEHMLRSQLGVTESTVQIMCASDTITISGPSSSSHWNGVNEDHVLDISDCSEDSLGEKRLRARQPKHRFSHPHFV